MNEAEWLEWRARGIGASDIARAVTGSYGGAVGVVAEKQGIRHPNPIDPDRAARGHRWEPVLADGLAAHTGLYVGGEQQTFEHPDFPVLRCSSDGLLLEHPEMALDDIRAGFELKTRDPMAPSRRAYAEVQAQTNLEVTGMDRWCIVIGTIDYVVDEPTAVGYEMLVDVRYQWIYRDPYLGSTYLELARTLWDHVEGGTLPEVTDAGELPWVKAAMATSTVPASSEAMAAVADDVARLDTLKAAAKKAKDEAAIVEAKIRAAIGGDREAMAGTWRVRCGDPVRRFTDASEESFLNAHADREDLWTWRRELDREAAARELPDEFEAHKVELSHRVLTIKDMAPTKDDGR